jgi:hypothetical protein
MMTSARMMVNERGALCAWRLRLGAASLPRAIAILRAIASMTAPAARKRAAPRAIPALSFSRSFLSLNRFRLDPIERTLEDAFYSPAEGVG